MIGFVEVPTSECPGCHQTVPAAPFCGSCGAARTAPVTARGTLLRPAVYAAAPREPLWTPRISSTCLPRLAAAMRKPFGVGLILVLVAVVILAAAGANGPVGVVAVLGWPLLFLIYLWQTDVFRDIPIRILVLAAALGVALGVGWWLLAGRILAGSYGLSTGSALMLTGVLNVGLLITAGSAVLMLMPAVLTRLLAMPVRESLDGFVVGAFGALWFMTAASTTIVAPQFVEGLIDDRGAARVLEDALSYGIVNPITATAAGGLVGMSLWFTPDRRPGRNPGRARTALTLCTVVGAPVYLAVWLVDATSVPPAVDLSLKLALAVLALLVVRCAVQI
ncbi:MAG: zinc ribbon domain-containing protein, partial [Mycobacterium sp.]|nr:zinc ribbon domain-containing protein [Mycobacterium sp.]